MSSYNLDNVYMFLYNMYMFLYNLLHRICVFITTI